jgi:hypothetical protein
MAGTGVVETVVAAGGVMLGWLAAGRVQAHTMANNITIATTRSTDLVAIECTTLRNAGRFLRVPY